MQPHLGFRRLAGRSISLCICGAGLRPGEHVAILLGNGLDWVCFDLAAHAIGLVVVGLYPQETATTNATLLGHSDARLILLDSEARWQSLAAFQTHFPILTHVWICQATEANASSVAWPIVRKLSDVLVDEYPPPPHTSSPSDVATLIYTSGTTGRPKGVMLSHFAHLWNAEAVAKVLPPRSDDVFLSVLPLTHAFERTVGYYLPMMGGCAVAHARAPQELQSDLKVLRPTVVLGVPFLYQRLASTIRSRLERNPVKRNLVRLTAWLGWRQFERARHRGVGGIAEKLLQHLLAHSVAASILSAFGGRLRVVVSGGAALDTGTARFLIGLGIPLVEGYGLSEAGPVVAANGLKDSIPGSSGYPLPGVDVRLGAEGELLVRSPSAMTGYWKDEIQTARALDATRWLATGDVADLENGRIFIRGRLKDMIVLSIGEKVDPNIIEAAFSGDPLIDQIMVVGDRRRYLVALVVLNRSNWEKFAADKGFAPDRPNEQASKAVLLTRLASKPNALAALRSGPFRTSASESMDHRGWIADTQPQGEARSRSTALCIGNRGALRRERK